MVAATLTCFLTLRALMPSASRTSATALRIAALVVATVLLTACQARLVIDISVDARGGGQLTVRLGADDDLLAEAAQAGVDPLDDLAEVGRRLEDAGWETVEAVADDGGRTVALTVGFADPEAFNEVAADLVEALAAPEVVVLERLRLSIDEGELRLEGLATLEPGPAVTELGLQPEEAVELVAAHDAFAYTINATLPGELLDTTADDVAMPLSWEVAPGEQRSVLAITELPGPRWWVFALGAAAILAAIATFWALATARSERR